MNATDSIEEMVGSHSLEFVEGLLADYLRNPQSVDPDWRSYFDAMTDAGAALPMRSPAGENDDAASGNGADRATVKQIGPSFRPASLFKPPAQLGMMPRAIPPR